jgi:16S rRNA (adenine1518-N6/adenine1519-N6)-dimethyltransferase
VWAVEADPALHAHLAAAAVGRHGGLHLVCGDGVELPLAGLPPELAPRCKVVANLPYAISTPWMDAVLGGPLPLRMVLMLQAEAAERYVAREGTRAFGAISIFLQAAYEPAPGHRVSPACFHPRPEVDSVLLHLVRREAPLVFGAAAKALIRRCFQQRRKQIGSVLREAGPAGGDWLRLLAAQGLAPTLRAEAIPVAAWMRLAGARPSTA